MLALESTYTQLPPCFYQHIAPEPVAAPSMISVNIELGKELGFTEEWLRSAEATAVFAGNAPLFDAEPLALAYAGHQFAHFVPQLGDGRAVVIGEVRDKKGRLQDLQLKGSGQTAFSRRGDGRSPLGPALREYLVSESMHALGVPTTRSLAVVATGEPVYRESMLPGGISTRVADSHLRVGTFEYAATQDDPSLLPALVEYAIARLYPEVAEDERPVLSFFRAVCERQADLVATWMSLGFIHGVMNTDNMAISGQTIDFGPCAFMEAYDPATVFSAIDRRGRYAYGNQGSIAHWNLASLARCLMPLFDDNAEQATVSAEEALKYFGEQFGKRLEQKLVAKLGLVEAREEDLPLVQEWLSLLADADADFTSSFRSLSASILNEGEPQVSIGNEGKANEWASRWYKRVLSDSAYTGYPEQQKAQTIAERLDAINPVFIPRNHLVQEVLTKVSETGSGESVEEFLSVMRSPFTWQPEAARYSQPATEEQEVCTTFCGT